MSAPRSGSPGIVGLPQMQWGAEERPGARSQMWEEIASTVRMEMRGLPSLAYTRNANEEGDSMEVLACNCRQAAGQDTMWVRRKLGASRDKRCPPSTSPPAGFLHKGIVSLSHLFPKQTHLCSYASPLNISPVAATPSSAPALDDLLSPPMGAT